jgi:RIO kinase 1
VKAPAALLELIDDGIINAVLRPLKSGKEAAVYVVQRGDEICCAKVYKDMAQRSFKNRVQYQEGRKARGSRESRAMGKASSFGKRAAEAAWKTAEVDALYRFSEAGVRVPRPYGFYGGVLLMELVTDADGHHAPRLGEVELEPEVARAYHARLIREVVRMLCCGLIHGDLSEYNVLVDVDGPVVIDFPQVVDAAGNNAARDLLRRDVNNLSISLGRAAPELMQTRFAEEMWALYEAGKLLPDSPLSGEFEEELGEVDLDAIEWAIRDAREQALIREQGRLEADADD